MFFEFLRLGLNPFNISDQASRLITRSLVVHIIKILVIIKYNNEYEMKNH